MQYQNFKQQILQKLIQEIPNATDISISPVYKNNGLLLDSLTILEGECNMSPSIYLNEFYDRLNEGESFESLYNEIMDIYREHRPFRMEDPNRFFDFESMKDKIVYRLVNYGKNASLLKTMPFIPYLDLAIIFSCHLPLPGVSGNGSFRISENHMQEWDMTPEELYPIAMENTQRLFPLLTETMDDFFQATLGTPLPQPGNLCFPFIMTNEARLYGAGSILYKNALRDVSGRLHDNLVIIPSSIHEVLILPSTDAQGPKELNALIREVNETGVAPVEVLSDHAYYYSRSGDRVTIL